MSSVEMLNILQEKLPPAAFLSVFRRLYDVLGVAEYISTETTEKTEKMCLAEEDLEEEDLRQGRDFADVFNAEDDDTSTVASKEDLEDRDVEDVTIDDIGKRLEKIKML